ncbi:nucleotidyltransferase family protein [Alkalilacustris brevis]|uniref:nucleotidyltransferase family protein n=1 Tax=Alkalilacustris brevis TaxID=2026338 RepID=UPI000E0DC515|nr:nucleotidyltransferase family protein [Alkalilacustris brevis]
MQDYVLVLLTAAGASRRMRGRDKLLEPVRGQPLLAVLAARAGDSGAPVLVTLPPGDTARRAVLAPGTDSVTVDDAAEGMAASLRVGAAQALVRGAAGLMVLPADMPEITGADIAAMIRAFLAAPRPRPILRAQSQDGTEWGHPVILPARHLPELESLQGDTGARDLLRRHADELRGFPLPARHALTDLDTPEDWQAWRESREGKP